MPLAACQAFAGAHQQTCGRCTLPAWEHDARLVNGEAIPWPAEMLDQWRAIGLMAEPGAEPDPEDLPAVTVDDAAHNLCATCWNRRHPGRPMIPERIGLGIIEECCGCGNMNNDGVFWWTNAIAAGLDCANRSETHHFPLFEEAPPAPAPGQPLLAPYPNKLTR
jgi:hypothetical protein